MVACRETNHSPAPDASQDQHADVHPPHASPPAHAHHQPPPSPPQRPSHSPPPPLTGAACPPPLARPRPPCHRSLRVPKNAPGPLRHSDFACPKVGADAVVAAALAQVDPCFSPPLVAPAVSVCPSRFVHRHRPPARPPPLPRPRIERPADRRRPRTQAGVVDARESDGEKRLSSPGRPGIGVLRPAEQDRLLGERASVRRANGRRKPLPRHDRQ